MIDWLGSSRADRNSPIMRIIIVAATCFWVACLKAYLRLLKTLSTVEQTCRVDVSIEREVLAAMQAHVAARMSNDTDAVGNHTQMD